MPQTIAETFTKADKAKYSFLKETAEYIKKLDFRVQDIADPGMDQIIERAEERVEAAILHVSPGRRHRNDDIEIFSFPIAILIVLATRNRFVKKRYAIAEAKQAFEEMKAESSDKLKAIAHNFGWKLETNSELAIPGNFVLDFKDYIRNAIHLRDSRWKLTNQLLSKGNVYLTSAKIARLLGEEVRVYIEDRLSIKTLPVFPPKFTEISEKIMKLVSETIGETETTGFPRTVSDQAFPPCVSALYKTFVSGRHLSHIGRFTLTAFLVNIGMSSDRIIELFRGVSDFNEKLTRYQVEHIAGEKGSRTRYLPPKCDTLKTHGVCINPDRLCQKINHPLSYYKARIYSQEAKAKTR